METVQFAAAGAQVQLLVEAEAERSLGASIPLPGLVAKSPEAAWQIAPELLYAEGFALTEWATEPPVVVVIGPEELASSGLAAARFVQPDDLESLTNRPGNMVTTTVRAKQIDVRQLVNSLRALSVSSPGMQMIAPGNSSGLLLTGRAKDVIAMKDLVQAVDAMSRPSAEESLTPTETEPGN